jgi:hypothetical protein
VVLLTDRPDGHARGRPQRCGAGPREGSPQAGGQRLPIAGLRPDDVELRDGGTAKRDEPNRFESYSSILSLPAAAK